MMSLRNRSRSLVSADHVRAMTTPVVVGGCGPEHGGPKVRVVRTDEDLIEIRVTCACGEEISLECELESRDS